MRREADDLVAVELLPDEIRLLSSGLSEWGGPAQCTDELAVAMGFLDVHNLFQEAGRLRAALKEGAALTRRDWARILAATEIVFASDIFGAGVDWETTTGMSDEETIRLLRKVQRKLSLHVHGPAAQLGKRNPRSQY